MDSAWAWLITHMSDELHLVAGAPVLDVLTLAIWGVGLTAVFRGAYSVRLTNLNSRLELNDEQLTAYKNQLSGATPEEARSRMKSLEEQVTSLQSQIAKISPRRLSQTQQDIISRVAAKYPAIPAGHFAGNAALVVITNDLAVPDGKAYATDFLRAFKDAGWSIEMKSV